MAKRVWRINLIDVFGNPKALSYLDSTQFDLLQRQRRHRRIVEKRLERGEQPTKNEIEEALREITASGDDVDSLLVLVADFYPSRKARGRPPIYRPTKRDIEVLGVYFRALNDVRGRVEENDRALNGVTTTGRPRRNMKTEAQKQTAKLVGCSVREVQQIIADCPWRPTELFAEKT